jgi:hypothetical protein
MFPPVGPWKDYAEAYRANLARQHRPRWSWRRLAWRCRCGARRPCAVRVAEAASGR